MAGAAIKALEDALAAYRAERGFYPTTIAVLAQREGSGGGADAESLKELCPTYLDVRYSVSEDRQGFVLTSGPALDMQRNHAVRIRGQYGAFSLLCIGAGGLILLSLRQYGLDGLAHGAIVVLLLFQTVGLGASIGLGGFQAIGGVLLFVLLNVSNAMLVPRHMLLGCAGAIVSMFCILVFLSAFA